MTVTKENMMENLINKHLIKYLFNKLNEMSKISNKLDILLYLKRFEVKNLELFLDIIIT